MALPLLVIHSFQDLLYSNWLLLFSDNNLKCLILIILFWSIKRKAVYTLVLFHIFIHLLDRIGSQLAHFLKVQYSILLNVQAVNFTGYRLIRRTLEQYSIYVKLCAKVKAVYTPLPPPPPMFDIQNSISPLIRHYTSCISHKAKQEPEECVNSNIPRSISQKP